jgi:Ca2+-binding EF-hand superfamily protein
MLRESKQAKSGWEREVLLTTPLTKEDIAKIKPIFEYFDTDNDGFLSPSECALVFHQLGFPGTTMAVSLTDFPGFCRLVGILKRRAREKDVVDGKLRHTFHLMDQLSTGELTSADLRRYLKSIGIRVSEEQSDRIAELMYPEDQSSFDENAFVDFVKAQLAQMNAV